VRIRVKLDVNVIYPVRSHGRPDGVVYPLHIPPLQERAPSRERMGVLEIGDRFSGMVKGVRVDPGIFSMVVTFPVDKVLDSFSKSAFINNEVNFIFFMSLDQDRSWARIRSTIRRKGGWVVVTFQPRNMESQVDVHGIRKVQSVGHCSDPVKDLEGTHISGG
jgi:hypothetical protein